MAASPAEVLPRGSAEFVESSVLEAVVPASSEIDLEDELNSWQGVVEDESGSIFPFLSQRQVLLLGMYQPGRPPLACLLLIHRLLDELLPVYVVFRTPLLEDDVLGSYLARLVVNVEAFAFSTAPPLEGEPKTAPKEIIYSDVIKEEHKPTVVRHGEGDDAYTYVIWKVDVFICEEDEWLCKPKSDVEQPDLRDDSISLLSTSNLLPPSSPLRDLGSMSRKMSIYQVECLQH